MRFLRVSFEDSKKLVFETTTVSVIAILISLSVMQKREISKGKGKVD
jgi:hypothetical protein